ncbi:hypothetical protein V1264_009527 [Littorina saxatilis]|uniref:C2H2-type domain-containing protein n=2 Tax=Littorina saxatilis TaxID=31220 RepID=A0AAN9G2U7_9CAEN
MMHSNRAYLPSPRMYSAVVPGIPSPTLPPSSAASLPGLPQRGSDQGHTSPAYEAYHRDGGGGGGNAGGDSRVGNGNVAAVIAQAYANRTSSDKAQTAATMAYAARMQQEGFPYGLSGVPHMPSYNYGSELYNYVSNGFPRKSRICSYCAKVFTRSTTRRYHEKRCPLLRAAGSLMKGNNGAGGPPSAIANGPSDDGHGLTNGGTPPSSRPPPLIAVNRGETSPTSPTTHPAPSPSNNALSTSASTSYNGLAAVKNHNNNNNHHDGNSHSTATSAGLAPMGRPPHPSLNSPSQFYGGMYGSQQHVPPGVSTSPASLAAHLAAAQSPMDLNRNSVLSASIKQEVENGEPGSDTELLRNHKLGSRGDDGQSHGQHQQQQPMFSPLSATSRSPSGSRSRSEEEEAEGESEDGDSSFKAPGVKADTDMYSDPAFRQYYIAKLTAMQAARGNSAAPNFPSYANNSTLDKVSTAAEHDYRYASPSDKEEESLRDGDSSYRDEEDTDRYPATVEADDDVEVAAAAAVGTEEGKKCGICNQEFEKMDRLRTHERVHQKYKPNACRFCQQRFIKPSMRIAHQRLHSGKYSLGCVVCGLHMLTRFGLRQHVHREHYNPASSAVTFCRYCETHIDSVHDLRRHFHTHRHQVPRSERESIRYLRSPVPARSLSPLGGEEDEEEEEEEASQELPPPSNDSKTSQDSPMEVGSEPPPLLGPILPRGAAAAEGRPNGKVGGSREKEWCRICEKDFPKSFMRYHEREHADQKPYECPLCKKRFGYKNNMKSHMKLHAGIKPYQCSICLAKFTRGSTLRRHARRHGVNSDSIWDLFVKKNGGSMQDRAMLLNQARDTANAMAAAKGQGQGSPPMAGSRAMKADPALMASMRKGGNEGKGYDMRGYSPSGPVPQGLYNAYSSFPPAAAVTQAMLQPYMAAQQYLGYAAAFPTAAPAAPPSLPQQQQQPPPPPQSQAMQSDALDFSMPDKQRRRNSSSSSTSAQRPPSTASQSAYPTMERSPGYPPVSSAGSEGRRCHPNHAEMMEEEGEAVARGNGIAHNDSYSQRSSNSCGGGGRPSLGETVESYLETGGGGRHASQHPYHAQDFGAQVTLCCAHPPNEASTHSPPRSSHHHHHRPLDMSSPVKPRMEGIQHESLASLMSSGRLFRCPHCDCYFTDYTMFLLHQKIHLPDQPFTCFLCQEDCQDKMAFSKHLLDHLR